MVPAPAMTRAGERPGDGSGLRLQDGEVCEGEVLGAREVQLEFRAALVLPECRPGARLEGARILSSEQQERAAGAGHCRWRPEGAVQVDAGGDPGIGVNGVGSSGASVGVAGHSGGVEVERAPQAGGQRPVLVAGIAAAAPAYPTARQPPESRSRRDSQPGTPEPGRGGAGAVTRSPVASISTRRCRAPSRRATPIAATTSGRPMTAPND